MVKFDTSFMSEVPDVPSGWMAPDGTLVVCQPYRHWLCAEHIAKARGYQWTPTLDDDLRERGWLHITTEVTRDYVDGDSYPTQAQIDALWDLYQMADQFYTDSRMAQRAVNYLRATYFNSYAEPMD